MFCVWQGIVQQCPHSECNVCPARVIAHYEVDCPHSECNAEKRATVLDRNRVGLLLDGKALYSNALPVHILSEVEKKTAEIAEELQA